MLNKNQPNREKSLIEIAQEHKPSSWGTNLSDKDELLDLALAYANREITSSQCQAAYRVFLGPGKTISGGNHISRMGAVIISAARHGLLKIERIKNK